MLPFSALHLPPLPDVGLELVHAGAAMSRGFFSCVIKGLSGDV